MLPKTRKYDSGYEKRKKKKRIEELTLSQKGALDKFIIKDSQVSLENQNIDSTNVDGNNINDINICTVNIDNNNVPMNEENAPSEGGFTNSTDDICSVNLTNLTDNQEPLETFPILDIYDPRNWDALDSRMIDILVANGPKRDLSIVKGPKDKLSRQFSAAFYTRILPNGEKCDRDWLVYSKELDKVFCFCCKIFKKGCVRGQLANEGFHDWAHLCVRLTEHETSVEHVRNMATWYDLRLRLQKKQAIDELVLKQIEKEKEHWKNILLRIISIVKFLGKHNLAFRGTNERLFQKSNGNFLGLIEMLAEFDPVMHNHVERITNDEIHFHYLGHNIQNELINILASTVRSEITKRIKEAKYFSVILDCTPDVSHQEQMSLIIRYVDVASNCVNIEESFLGFLDVNNTTGQGLFDVLVNELKVLDLDIDNVRGQGYDNGSNMKGKNQGVQRKLLDINPRAFYTPCGAHSLNLMLCDMANTCGKARDFFGVIQRIYTIFANSTKRWQILKNNVKELTPKSLSSTRWESRIDSVKAIRFQISEIREALLQVSESDNDSKIKSEAKSLANNELGDFEFLVAIVIWYDILYVVNLVSKQLQSKEMFIDVALEQVQSLISFFKRYRENGFSSALDTAKKLAIDMEVDPMFPEKRQIRRKRHFDENLNDENRQTPEESFRVNYFIYIMDQAIVSLEKRFEQYKEYENVFGFLFTSTKLHSLDDLSLKSCCSHLENALKTDDNSDIKGYDLYVELKLVQELLPKHNMGAHDILKFLKRVDCFPNTIIAYRILLTIPVTVASAERSFSKLKLLKSYLRSTMSQERLNGLALVAIENDILEKIDYEDLIEDFASKNARRTRLFK